MASSGESIDLVVDNFENRYRKVAPLVRFFAYGRQLWGAAILIMFFGVPVLLLVQTISGRLDRALDPGVAMLLALLLGGGIVVTFFLDLVARNPGKVFGALCMVFVAAWLLINLPRLLLGIASGGQIAENASSQSALLATLLAVALLTTVLLHLYVLWVFARSALNLVAASKLEAALFRDVPPSSSILGGFFFRLLALPPILAFVRGRKLRFIIIVLLSLLAAFFTAMASIGMVSLPNLSLAQLVKIADLCIESSGFDGRSYVSSLYEKCTNAYAWPLLSAAFAGGLGFALFVGLGSLLQGAVRRLVRLSLEQLQRTDERAPILFLRAFGDDQVPLRPERASLFMRALEFGRRTKSLDQVLLEEGTPIGPVVALGNPTDKRPPYGAARGYFENKDWQEAVADLAHNSAAIVICLDDTQGIWWEVEHLAARGHVNKTLFLVHPKFSAPQPNRTFLERVREHFGGDALLLPLLETHFTNQPQSVLGFFIADGKLVILRSSTFSRAAFMLALRQFLPWRALPEDVRNRILHKKQVVTHDLASGGYYEGEQQTEPYRAEHQLAQGPVSSKKPAVDHQEGNRDASPSSEIVSADAGSIGTALLVLGVFSVPLVFCGISYFSPEVYSVLGLWTYRIIFTVEIYDDPRVVYVIVAIPCLLMGFILAKAAWDGKETMSNWIRPVAVALAVGPFVGGLVGSLVVWPAFGLPMADLKVIILSCLTNYFLGVPTAAIAVGLVLTLSRLRLSWGLLLPVLCSATATALTIAFIAAMMRREAERLGTEYFVYSAVALGIASVLAGWVCWSSAGLLKPEKFAGSSRDANVHSRSR